MTAIAKLVALKSATYLGLVVHHPGRQDAELMIDIVGYRDGGPYLTWAVQSDEAFDVLMAPIEENGWDYVPTYEYQAALYMAILVEIDHLKKQLINPRPNSIDCLLDDTFKR